MIDLTLFENPFPNIYVFKKWNWDYLDAESFQLKCVEFVYQNPLISIFIICSHPHCLTMGRGLQKIKNSEHQLMEFDRSLVLPFPVYDIKRGGGLTFHYPGQLVLYPIVSTIHHKIGVYDFMIKILHITKAILAFKLGMDETRVRTDLLGLWFENAMTSSKIASIGLAASRFVTYHGLALNIYNDLPMFAALSSLYPCGLEGNLYRDLETLSGAIFDFTLREEISCELIAALSTESQFYTPAIIAKNPLLNFLD